MIAGGWLAMLALTDPILSLAMIGIAGAIWLGRGGEPGQDERLFLFLQADHPFKEKVEFSEDGTGDFIRCVWHGMIYCLF